MAALSPAAQYAAAELFRGTMVRHSVTAYREDASFDPQPVCFTGDAWRGYVPIKLPDTICVEERLPPGAAAVLINRTHTYRDLYLPVDAQEKQLFEAIDGQRTLGEIVEKHSHPNTVRALFERLWWYDQVVFDASRAGENSTPAEAECSAGIVTGSKRYQ